MRHRRGFTLAELMVVIGIIVVLTALAVPGISKFLDGQGLQQSGRILQSAFNEARRAAITQRSNNYLIFFRDPDPSRPGQYRYGVRRWRDRFGYEGEAQYLLPGVQFDLQGTGVFAPLGGLLVGITEGGATLPVFDGLPQESNILVFTAARRPRMANPPGSPDGARIWLEFRRDGSIALMGGGRDLPPYFFNGKDIYTNNDIVEVNTNDFDNIAAACDMNLSEGDSSAGTDRRCFVDLDTTSGKLRFRSLQVLLENPGP